MRSVPFHGPFRDGRAKESLRVEIFLQMLFLLRLAVFYCIEYGTRCGRPPKVQTIRQKARFRAGYENMPVCLSGSGRYSLLAWRARTEPKNVAEPLAGSNRLTAPNGENLRHVDCHGYFAYAQQGVIHGWGHK